MKTITTFDPSIAAGKGVIDTKGINPDEQLMLYNDSLFGLQLTFPDGSIGIIPPSWNKDYVLKSMPMGKIQWQVYNQIVAAGYPISQVYGELYEADEHVSSVNAGMQRGFQITGGGLVAGNTLSNENSALGTKVVDIGTLTIADLLDIFNDHFLWKVQQAGVAHQVLAGNNAGNPLQLGQVGDITEVLGNLTIDGSSIHTGLTNIVNALVSGTIGITGLATLVNATLSGTLNVTGLTSLVNALISGTLGVTGLTNLGAASIGSTLGVTGATTMSTLHTTGQATVDGAVQTNRISDNVTGTPQIELATAGITIDNILTVKNAIAFLTAAVQSINATSGQKLIDATSGNNLGLNPPNNAAGNSIVCFTANTDRFDITDNGVQLKTGKYGFLAGSLGRITAGHLGALANGTSVSHGLTVVPSMVLVNTDIAQPGSGTVGAGGVTSSVFLCTAPATGAAGAWWCALTT